MIHQLMVPKSEPPFVAEVINEPDAKGHFTPTARIVLGASIPQFLGEVDAETLRTVVAVMSYVTPNGRVAPSLPDLAGRLGTPAVWLKLRLARPRWWRGQPVVRLLPLSGRVLVQPSTAIFGVREVTPQAATLSSVALAGRDRVLAVSRKRYARPRAAVEHEIMAHQGWPSAEEIEMAKASQPPYPVGLDSRWAIERLTKLGVDYPLAIKLVNEFGATACIRQCQLLPHRTVKKPARYIVAAIQNNYAAPAGIPDCPAPSVSDAVSFRSQLLEHPQRTEASSQGP